MLVLGSASKYRKCLGATHKTSQTQCKQRFPDSKVHGANYGPPGSCWSQIGPMLVPWTLLSGLFHPTSAKQIRRKVEWYPPTHQMKMMLPIKINLPWQCVERSLLHTWNNNWCRRMKYKLWFKQPQFIFPISNVVCKQNVISNQCAGYLVSAFS